MMLNRTTVGKVLNGGEYKAFFLSTIIGVGGLKVSLRVVRVGLVLWRHEEFTRGTTGLFGEDDKRFSLSVDWWILHSLLTFAK